MIHLQRLFQRVAIFNNSFKDYKKPFVNDRDVARPQCPQDKCPFYITSDSLSQPVAM